MSHWKLHLGPFQCNFSWSLFAVLEFDFTARDLAQQYHRGRNHGNKAELFQSDYSIRQFWIVRRYPERLHTCGERFWRVINPNCVRIHLVYVCITYDTSIGQGIINQTIVEEWHNSHWPANYYSWDDLPIANSVANDSYIIGPTPPGKSEPQTYNISMVDLVLISMFLQNLTDGVGTMSNDTIGDGYYGTEFSQSSIQPFF